MKKFLYIFLFFLIYLIDYVYAHCPLCTVGAATVAGGALYLGVSQVVIGLFIGGFAVSMGMWFARLIKKKYVPFQSLLIVLFSFLATIIPLLPLMKEIIPFYISLYGGYGTFLNKTYIFNSFLVGSIPGGVIVMVSPWISKRISSLRNNKVVPFQGTILTISFLIILGIIFQLAL